MKTGLMYHPIFREHRPSYGHPEAPERYDAALIGARRALPEGTALDIRARYASDAELTYCHTPEYIRIVRDDVARGADMLRTGDTELSERSLDAALMAAGGTFEAVDAVIGGRAQNTFCIVRPPGHHALPDRGMGFCIFNNVALAARHAQRRHGIERVLIVDWDVHHGNGTQAIFYEDPTVFYFSTHQWPAFPGTGIVDQRGLGAGKGFTLNCPFPTGSGGHEVIGAFREKLVPAMRAFRPELVLISAGFDGRHSEPLCHFVMRDEDFRTLTGLVLRIAADYAEGRVVSVLEGGYNLDGLATAVETHVAALAGIPPH